MLMRMTSGGRSRAACGRSKQLSSVWNPHRYALVSTMAMLSMLLAPFSQALAGRYVLRFRCTVLFASQHKWVLVYKRLLLWLLVLLSLLLYVT